MRPDLSLRHYGPSPGSHAHEHFQVLVGISGLLELEIEGRGAYVGAGDALLVRPGDRHDFESPRGSRCLVLDAADALWERCTAQPQRREQVRALGAYLSEALALGQPIARLHGPALLLEAWAPTAPASSPHRLPLAFGAHRRLAARALKPAIHDDSPAIGDEARN